MLTTLTQNFSDIIKKIQGRGRLSEENIRETALLVRRALLDADVALPVVDDFLAQVETEALGRKVVVALNPGQQFIRILHAHLTQLMGGGQTPLQLKKTPALVLACGLQGAGKTTTLGKIAKKLKTRDKKRVLLASVDIRRPAAIEQLRALAAAAEVSHFEHEEMQDARARARHIIPQARRELAEVILVDTAGRTALDEAMMAEIAALAKMLDPAETLFFVDALQGQDAVNTARRFAAAVPLSGLVLTKFDGDSRGGAALSAKAVTGCPIKFVGVGEKMDDLQDFHPARFASRLLGLGDIASLAEQAQEKTDSEAMNKIGKKLRNPDGFDLNDQLAQIRQMSTMGGLSAMVDKLPAPLAQKMGDAAGGGQMLKQMESAILSMTAEERRRPEIIKASRKRRIAAGAGILLAAVNQLLKQHEQTRKIMKRFSKNPSAMMRTMRNMLG